MFSFLSIRDVILFLFLISPFSAKSNIVKFEGMIVENACSIGNTGLTGGKVDFLCMRRGKKIEQKIALTQINTNSFDTSIVTNASYSYLDKSRNIVLLTVGYL